MSVAKRPFADLRNTYFVENNDPGAFDTTHRGTPGVHTEQRCCRDRAPYMEGTTSLYYVNAQGEKQSVTDPNAEPPAGWSIEQEFIPSGELWCHECATALEKVWGDVQDAAGPVLHIVSMAVTYVPVFGTAISFCINVSLTLAEGGNIEEAVLDGIGRALPGQPASGMAFNVARSIVKGNRIDTIAIEALPIDRSAKTAINAAVSIVEDIASGKKLDDIAIREIYTALPDEGKKAMDVATRIAKGENIGDMVLSEAEEAAAAAMQDAANYAKTQGKDAVNRFIAESGYQGTMDMIPPELGDGLKAGILAGLIEKRQFDIAIASQGSFDFSEKNVATNDAYAENGRKIINTGAKWKGRLLSDIRNGSSFTITHDVMNGLTGRNEKRNQTYEINDLWRRGFEIAIGLCEGSQVEDVLQIKVGTSLVGHTRFGFDAGQEIQFDRTNPVRLLVRDTTRADAIAAQAAALVKSGAIKVSVSGADASAAQAAVLDKPKAIRQSASLWINRRR